MKKVFVEFKKLLYDKKPDFDSKDIDNIHQYLSQGSIKIPKASLLDSDKLISLQQCFKSLLILSKVAVEVVNNNLALDQLIASHAKAKSNPVYFQPGDHKEKIDKMGGAITKRRDEFFAYKKIVNVFPISRIINF